MTVPYNDDTRENYIKREKEKHLHIAEVHHRLGNKRSTWLALLYWAMSDDIYGTHWDKVQEIKNERTQETQT